MARIGSPIPVCLRREGLRYTFSYSGVPGAAVPEALQVLTSPPGPGWCYEECSLLELDTPGSSSSAPSPEPQSRKGLIGILLWGQQSQIIPHPISAPSLQCVPPQLCTDSCVPKTPPLWEEDHFTLLLWMLRTNLVSHSLHMSVLSR